MSLPANLEREYEEAFSLIDKDRDKNITPAEFESIITKMGAPEPKKVAAHMWKDSGASSSMMSYDQFKKAFLDTFVIENKKQEIIEAWQVFDAEKTGKIHQEEIKLIFSQMGNQLDSAEIAELVAHLQPDKDGKCDYLKLTERMFTLCREK
jgi:Ca2+-binding EF-hand superfamily protein